MSQLVHLSAGGARGSRLLANCATPLFNKYKCDFYLAPLFALCIIRRSSSGARPPNSSGRLTVGATPSLECARPLGTDSPRSFALVAQQWASASFNELVNRARSRQSVNVSRRGNEMATSQKGHFSLSSRAKWPRARSAHSRRAPPLLGRSAQKSVQCAFGVAPHCACALTPAARNQSAAVGTQR